MSYRLKISGASKIIHVPSQLYPAAGDEYLMECDKHPGSFVKFAISALASFDEVINAAYEALKKCAGCEHIQQHKESRWPNAGEPGGAEL